MNLYKEKQTKTKQKCVFRKNYGLVGREIKFLLICGYAMCCAHAHMCTCIWNYMFQKQTNKHLPNSDFCKFYWFSQVTGNTTFWSPRYMRSKNILWGADLCAYIYTLGTVTLWDVLLLSMKCALVWEFSSTLFLTIHVVKRGSARNYNLNFP